MAPTSSPLHAPAAAVTAIPAVPGLPVVGNLLAFRRDRLALQDAAARVAPIARLSLAPHPGLRHHRRRPRAPRCSSTRPPRSRSRPASSSSRRCSATACSPPRARRTSATASCSRRRSRRKRLAAYGEVMVDETRASVARWQPGQRDRSRARDDGDDARDRGPHDVRRRRPRRRAHRRRGHRARDARDGREPDVAAAARLPLAAAAPPADAARGRRCSTRSSTG